MYELKVTVKKVMGECTSDPPMKPGDSFTVSDGDIRVPDGGHICLWALQTLMPLLPAKEREIREEDEDWMWRVRHAQCPDPAGRVIFEIERTGKLERRGEEDAPPPDPSPPVEPDETDAREGLLRNLRVEVESVGGKCTSGMKPGDSFELKSGRLYVPAGGHICLYALQATLPFLPAKQRTLQDGDWMKEDARILCPDPAGNVILRIDRPE